MAPNCSTGGCRTSDAAACCRPSRWAAEPFEIAGTVAFLASRDAGYLTGEVVTVDGGHTAWAGPR